MLLVVLYGVIATRETVIQQFSWVISYF